MARLYIPLLPLPVLAVLVAFSACTKPRTEETTRVIPPAVALAPVAQPPLPAPAALAAGAAEEKPTADDVREFERPVRK